MHSIPRDNFSVSTMYDDSIVISAALIAVIIIKGGDDVMIIKLPLA